MSSARQNILLVGCGHLGQAMLRRWLVLPDAPDFTVIKPSTLPDDLADHPRVDWHPVAPPAVLADVAHYAAVIYAARPQQLPNILPLYRRARADAHISVAAGFPMAKLQQGLEQRAVIRAMPNLPAQIGQGMTAAYADPACGAAAKDLTARLFGAVGDFIWLDDEKHMDAVTALSGSGPAYLFLLTAAMTDAGVALGLDRAVAERLARQTVKGAAAYMVETGGDAVELYRAVQSPGGTTEAAMTRLLDSDGMTAMLTEAMRRAAARAAEIGK